MSDQPSRPADHALPLSDRALESMPFPMNLYRPDGLIVASNAGVEQLFAYPHHRIVNTYNLYDDPTTAANGFRAAFERARLGETVTIPPNHFDPTQLGIPGDPIWFTATLFPFAAADGTVAWIGAVYQDVTAQVRAEAERARLTDELARRAREFQPFYALAENAPDGFVLAGMDQRIIYANRALKAMTGYGEELVGRRIVDLVVGDVDGQMQAMAEALKTSGAWQGETAHRHKDGEIFPVQLAILLIRDEAGTPQGTAGIVRNLAAQRRAESERAALQEQVIASQQAALRELSTPLIPLTDAVVVMPLVGAIDSRRAQQIMETLLEGIATHQAEVVLLDISGVRVVDTQVADALLRAAHAVRLLGAQVVLTGISAEIAQTIVHLGADMQQLVTRANLQAGLRYALARHATGGGSGPPQRGRV